LSLAGYHRAGSWSTWWWKPVIALEDTVASEYLLTEADPPAFELVNSYGGSNTVLICDHAGNRIPQRLGNLGLGPDLLMDHIAWDPGAAAVARVLSELLDAPLVLSAYSRLVIDCNRPLESPESIAEESAGTEVPGNRGLTSSQRRRRIDEVFRPYHRAIGALLDARSERPSLLLSIHSFVGNLGGVRRPWSIGVANRQDRSLADCLILSLQENDIGPVGNNEPYGIEDAYDYSLPTHGERRGIAHAMIEIRQNGLRNPAHARLWAERLAAASHRAERRLL
jgi:predicted N-formylglutamate amidohydrolase